MDEIDILNVSKETSKLGDHCNNLNNDSVVKNLPTDKQQGPESIK